METELLHKRQHGFRGRQGEKEGGGGRLTYGNGSQDELLDGCMFVGTAYHLTEEIQRHDWQKSVNGEEALVGLSHL